MSRGEQEPVTAPSLDDRTGPDFYAEALDLAQIYFSRWTEQWPRIAGEPVEVNAFPSADVGLVGLKLFSLLADFQTDRFNEIPFKYRLAFFNFMQTRRRLARAAETILTFKLTEEALRALAPAGVEVASSENQEIVFSTLDDLEVVRALPAGALSIDPAQDVFADNSAKLARGETFLLFSGSQAVPHALYLGSRTLFHIVSPARTVVIEIEGANLEPRYFARWLDGAGNYLATEVQSRAGRLVATLRDVGAIQETVINGEANYWLQVMPASDVRITRSAALPEMSAVNATVQADGILPDAAYYNDAALDVLNGFYPFGETPAKDDVFYLSSNEVFPKTGAEIVLNFEFAAPLSDPDAVLSWEYWDGETWSSLRVNDGTKNFTQSGAVSFPCPDIVETTVGSEAGYWIRAWISAGGFGTAGQYVVTEDVATVISSLEFLSQGTKDQIIGTLENEGINFGFRFDPPSYQPPFVNSLTIAYSIRSSVAGLLAYNAFRFRFLSPGDRPYTPALEPAPTFYLGFEPDRFYESAAGRKITIYFPFIQDQTDEHASAVYEYYDGSRWAPLTVFDGASGLRQSGILSFETPAAIQSAVLFESNAATLAKPTEDDANNADEDQEPTPTALGARQYWIRALRTGCLQHDDAAVSGIYTNAVRALNRTVIRDEILGASNGEPNLKLTFSSAPILRDPVVEVREPRFSTDDELQSLIAAGQAYASEEGELQGGFWVRWEEVPNFTLSGPRSRHYVLDHATGVIAFGDNVQGRVPPQGEQNIRAAQYYTGGGVSGNVPANTLTSVLDNLEEIESVTNPAETAGGADADGVAEAEILAPREIQNRNRAVVLRDYEWLARQSSPEVVRGHSYRRGADVVTAILAGVEGPRPLPRPALLQEVQSYLRERALFSAAPRVFTSAPLYVAIDAAARLRLAEGARADLVRRELEDLYAAYFFPYTGNNGLGWDFCAEIFVAAVQNLFEDAVGVEYVATVALNNVNADRIRLVENQLPTAGVVELEFI